MTLAPYGSWVSPITAADYAAGEHPVAGGAFVGDEVWWLELRSAEAGRYAVRRTSGDGRPEDILPAPWNARTRVHEYGGGAWTVTSDAVLIFAEFSDQRLYRLEPGSEPTPLTPETSAAWRYGELSISHDGTEVWCVRERHDGASVSRDIAAVPLDGSAVSDRSAIRSVVGGSHFLAAARVSPDGRQLAWIAWEHPQMPWDGTELRVAELDASGKAGPWHTLLGSTTESVLQPEWADDATLYTISDRNGFWNLYRVPAAGGEAEALHPIDADIGGALWQLGLSWYAPLDATRLLTVRTVGTDTLAVLDTRAGTLTDIDLGDHDVLALGALAGQDVLLLTGSARVASGLRRLDLRSESLHDIRLGTDVLPDAAYLPEARLMTFAGPGDRDVHAIIYPPHNADFEAPAGELAPYVAFVHGGPTSRTVPKLSVLTAYFTSRGIGIVDVNYGGSTGYGREYRDRLRGQWGIVDVEDTVAAVRGLVAAGLADPARLAIEGGSAGGWTVLSALTQSDAFACGVSYFGVAELVEFAAETHDFESRYLDGLIGALPEMRELYDTRAPVNNVDGLSCPVLLLQGLDDLIVPPAQSERFRDALLAKRIPHAYRAYAGESHGFRRSETLIDSRESELSFYGQIFGFDPPGIATLQLWRPPVAG